MTKLNTKIKLKQINRFKKINKNKKQTVQYIFKTNKIFVITNG